MNGYEPSTPRAAAGSAAVAMTAITMGAPPRSRAFRHKPKLHVNYQETVLRIEDGLPKMRDMPKEMGGSGEILPE